MADIRFGTDGWRAIIAEDFTFSNLKIVAQGIANYIKSQNLGKKGLVIAYDNRFLSDAFAAECARVILGNGIRVHMFTKAVPTPLAAYAIRFTDAGGAIMITASHNPPEYSGIKFIPEYAGPASTEITGAIESEVSRILAGCKVYELDLKEAVALDLYKEIDLDNEYIGQLLKVINPKYIKERPLKVVVDPMYGAGIGYLDRILTDLGCEVRAINNYRDAMFGGSMPEPVDLMLTDLKRAVTSYKANVGLALDGDADRFGLVDGEGKYITTNGFAPILLDHLIKTRGFRGPVCRSIATTHMLDRVAKKNGLNVIETPVGFKHISEHLREKGCIMGVEESGGLSIVGHVPEKDGILACLLVAEVLAYQGKSPDQLLKDFQAEYGGAVSERLDIKTTQSEKGKVLADLRDYRPKQVAGVKVEFTDQTEGQKIVLENGSWFLVRPSGTEPLFRIYLEASEKVFLEEMKNEVLISLGLKQG